MRRIDPTDTTGVAVSAALAAIDEAIDEGRSAPSLQELSSIAHLSATQLRRIFVERVGVSPRAYADARRAERLRDTLASGAPVAQAIAESGYGSPSRVYERTDDLLGMSPAAASKGGPGEHIRYAVTDSSLGRVLVGMTERGVCLVVFGDSDEAVLDELRRRFPRATIEPSRGTHAEWVEAVVRVIDAPGSTREADRVPLDAHGTVFQRQVWSALRTIPAGQTFTYAQLAAAIGRPTATRAVAQACGANPTAVVVPCHRVIGADGRLTGYRWGVERKRELLEREGASIR